jgi:hypothetical protein
MGSPQYGRLIVDGRVISRPLSIEPRSLLWSDDGTRLAAQELVSTRSVRESSSSTRERAVRSRAHHRAQVSGTPSGSSETSSCTGTGITRQANRSGD